MNAVATLPSRRSRRPLPRACVDRAAVLLVAACALPLLVSNYRMFQFTLVLVYAIALLGLNMLTGYNGQISLGHGAFYAIGAYTAAILMDKFGVPYWATLPVAGAVCLVVGFLFGLPALRLEGLYLALATFALGVSLPQLLKYKHLEHWTGGVQGIVIIKPDAPFGLPLSSRTSGSTFHAGGHRGDVRARLEPAARAHRPRAGRDPRPPDRRRGDGRQHRALQVARPSASAPCTPASPARWARSRSSSSRPTASPSSCRSASWSASWSAAWPRSRARSTARCSSSSCPTSPTRSPRPRPGRSSAFS